MTPIYVTVMPINVTMTPSPSLEAAYESFRRLCSSSESPGPFRASGGRKALAIQLSQRGFVTVH